MKTILIAHNYSENSFASMSFQLAHHLAELGNRVVFISHKPFFKFVLAFNLFKEKNPATKIIINIAGTGSQKSQIEKVIANTNSIEYHGGLAYGEIDAYLSSSHYTIIPSKFDALNMVGIESLMNKTPLLISNTTGLAEYLSDGLECYKFDATIESMIFLLERVERNFKDHEEMSNNARITYQKYFSMNHYFENITNLIS
jgi:glycosyltransferase involved in cell wall biosynthesis